jgi:hypothetical protein
MGEFFLLCLDLRLDFVLYFFVLLLDLGVGGFHFTDGGSNY